MLVLSHNEAHDAYHLGICGKHRRCLGCIPRRQTPCGQVVGKWPGSERQEESRSGGRWAGLDRTAAMLSVKLKLEWPIEPRSWEVLLQGRNKFRRASPIHVKAVLGELRRQHSQSSGGTWGLRTTYTHVRTRVLGDVTSVKTAATVRKWSEFSPVGPGAPT